MTPLLNSQGQPLYVLRRISDKFVINPRAISNTTGLPNPGPDQEYLPIMVDPVPDNDPVYTIVTQVEAPNETLTPPEWWITYDVADRPLSERLAAAENYKRFEVQKHAPPEDFTESVLLTLAAVLRLSKGLALTADEQAHADRLVATAAKLSQNAVHAEDLKTAIAGGQKPDLKSGWQAVGP